MQARLMLHPTAFKCRNTTNLFANAHADKGSADEKSIRGLELEEFAVRVGRNPQRTRAAWWMFSLLTGRKSGRTSSDRRSSAFDPSGN
jgi:hypothetical protein